VYTEADSGIRNGLRVKAFELRRFLTEGFRCRTFRFRGRSVPEPQRDEALKMSASGRNDS
jgi:hypothetical protein